MSDKFRLRWECTDDDNGQSDPRCGDIVVGIPETSSYQIIAQEVDENFASIICDDVNNHDELLDFVRRVAFGPVGNPEDSAADCFRFLTEDATILIRKVCPSKVKS